ncbi:Protein tyrosine kinase [Musa troglodytarum]|uniref:Protein tyrosine kinase n=1 Tax=Musa troglodytarum TaxID=320322 RepID=A0A9E7L2D0_9LILI|nr:Protein tyrosine kinase [Musa troglodytarum]
MGSDVRSWVKGSAIGTGAFGVVHLALDESTGRAFAVKSVSLGSSPVAWVQSLEREIQILRSLRSPYVVAYLGDDTSQEPRAGACRNLHLEYMPGGTVAESAAAAKAKGLPLDEIQVRAYARCVVRALRYLHDIAGVVHCDVKGRNVLLGRDRRVAKLADFGAAVRIADASRGGDGRGWVRGTPLWMAPEVARGERPTPASDVWSLGCTVIEMVTGAPPWPDVRTNNAAGAMLRIGYGGETPEFPVRLSDIGQDFLARCFRRDASERWTAEQLLWHPFLAKESVITGPSPRGVLEWANTEFHDDDDGDDDSIKERCTVSSSYDHQAEEMMDCARGRVRELASDRGAFGWCSDGWELIWCSESEEEEIVVEGMCEDRSSSGRAGSGDGNGSAGEPSEGGLCSGMRRPASCSSCRCSLCWRRCYSCNGGLGCQHALGMGKSLAFAKKVRSDEFSLTSLCVLTFFSPKGRGVLLVAHVEEEAAADAGEEEDTGAHVSPIVRLEEVAVTTGEEDEDSLLDLYFPNPSLLFSRFLLNRGFWGRGLDRFFCCRRRRAKLYRFDKVGNQWKERGSGNVKLLKHKETGKVRLVMRQAKTLKICANHLVVPSIKMQEHAGSDKSCVWHAMDFSDGELKEEMFAIRFGSVENCKKFREMVEEIAESVDKIEENESKDVSSAASLIEKLTVSENKTEGNTTKEAAHAEDEKKEVHEEKQANTKESYTAS